MASKEISVGADRFLALQWVNYAYELSVSSIEQDMSREKLKAYLQNQMLGQESIRKTSDQLIRLWLYSADPCEILRVMARSFSNSVDNTQLAIFHLGMAINVFPIYRETVRVIGNLEKITDQISAQVVSSRVIEKFPTTSSIPRSVNRVLQTLNDWGFIDLSKGRVAFREYLLRDPKLVNWYILALLKAIGKNEITLKELEICPLKLGVNFSHPRSVINQSEELNFSRDQQGVEVVCMKKQ